jgi:beta-mannosidase
MCYWDRKHLDYNVNMTSAFLGEFGLACMPVYESVQRYLPEEEKNEWPPREDGAFVYHTPVFGRREDLSRLTQYARYFVQRNCTMQEFIVGSQLSQATGVRHTLERARIRWPDCSGALYYKMNDNFPAASWASVDWYGAPKIGHYVFQDAFSPLHACILFSTLNFANTPVDLPIFLLDDANDLKESAWKVQIRAYNGRLNEIKSAEFPGNGEIKAPFRLGNLSLSHEETDTCPLLIVTDVIKDGILADRTFYWTNYEADRGCLFRLPETSLSYEVENDRIIVKNTGGYPAVAVNVSCPGQLDVFVASDNYFWLDVGEEKIVRINLNNNIEVTAWNIRCEG